MAAEMTVDLDGDDWEAKLEAYVREEHEAEAGGQPTPGAADDDTQPPEGQAPATDAVDRTEPEQTETKTEEQPKETTTATPATEPEKPAQVAGVLGKDGQVLPHSVLKGAREEAKQHRLAKQAAEAEAAQLREKLAAFEKGPAKDMRERAEEGLLTDEEREAFADSPVVKLEAAILEMRKLAKPEPTKAEAKPAQEERSVEDEVQEAIDSVPALATWQASDPVKWKRAVEQDDTLRESPRWKGRPEAERFAYVAQLVQAKRFDDGEDDSLERELLGPAPPPPSPPKEPTTPAKGRQDPAKLVEQARRAAPNTLSDFKGGADPGRQSVHYEDMTDDEIEADLRKHYGEG